MPREGIITVSWLGLTRLSFRTGPDARVLILDEPTSALDKTSELIITQTIRELASRLMVIVIAHRLQTVRWADQILLLEQGRLIAQGNHETFLADCPQYRELFGKSK